MPLRDVGFSLRRIRRRKNCKEGPLEEFCAEQGFRGVSKVRRGTDRKPTPQHVYVLETGPTLCCTYLIPGDRRVRYVNNTMGIRGRL